MTAQFQIDAFFRACASGELNVNSLASTASVSKIRDIDGHTLLEVAVASRQYEISQILLKLSFTNVVKNRALLEAVKTGDAKLTELVLGTIKCVPTSTRVACIQAACSAGLASSLRLLLAAFPGTVADNYLALACEAGRKDVVRVLLDAGAVAHRSADGAFVSSLLRSFRADDLGGVLDVLMQDGAAVAPGAWKQYSWRTGSPEFARCALSACGHAEKAVAAMLKWACSSGHADVAEHLIEVAQARGYAINHNSMFVAALEGKAPREFVEGLLTRFSIDLGTLDRDSSLLAAAAEISSERVVGALLAAGWDANAYVGNDTSDRVLGHAHDPAVARLLLGAGAKVSWSSFYAACRRLQPETVRLLLAALEGKLSRAEYPLAYAATAKCAGDQVETKIQIINQLWGAAGVRPHCPDSTLRDCLRHPDCEPETLAAVHAGDPRMIEHAPDHDDKKPLWLAVSSPDVSPATVRTLVELGASFARGSDRPLLHTLFYPRVDRDDLASFYDMMETAPQQQPRVAREKLRILLAAGADPTPTGAAGKTLLMLFSAPRTKAERRAAENEMRRMFRRDIAEDGLDVWYSFPRNFSDRACSVFIADVLDSILARKGGEGDGDGRQGKRQRVV
jgi:hypothetical protein